MDNREFLLARLRQATIEARLIEAQLISIGVALKGDMIDAETAKRWVRDAGLLEMVLPLPLPIEEPKQPLPSEEPKLVEPEQEPEEISE